MARPSPTPCRVCSRLCVSNKFSHFRQNLQSSKTKQVADTARVHETENSIVPVRAVGPWVSRWCPSVGLVPA
eukprot:scaffold69088_cov60-Phaeocystis_antarctica.AAC.4